MPATTILTFPLFLLRQHLRDVARSGRGWVDCPAGVAWHGAAGDVELIVARRPGPPGRLVRLSLGGSWAEPSAGGSGGQLAGVLRIGAQDRAGHAVGWLKGPQGQWRPLDVVRLTGPGMHNCSGGPTKMVGWAICPRHCNVTVPSELQ